MKRLLLALLLCAGYAYADTPTPTATPTCGIGVDLTADNSGNGNTLINIGPVPVALIPIPGAGPFADESQSPAYQLQNTYGGTFDAQLVSATAFTWEGVIYCAQYSSNTADALQVLWNNDISYTADALSINIDSISDGGPTDNGLLLYGDNIDNLYCETSVGIPVGVTVYAMAQLTTYSAQVAWGFTPYDMSFTASAVVPAEQPTLFGYGTSYGAGYVSDTTGYGGFVGNLSNVVVSDVTRTSFPTLPDAPGVLGSYFFETDYCWTPTDTPTDTPTATPSVTSLPTSTVTLTPIPGTYIPVYQRQFWGW